MTEMQEKKHRRIRIIKVRHPSSLKSALKDLHFSIHPVGFVIYGRMCLDLSEHCPIHIHAVSR